MDQRVAALKGRGGGGGLARTPLRTMQTLNVRTSERFLKLFCNNVDSDLPNALDFSRIYLMFMSKPKLKKTANLFKGTLNEHCHHDSPRRFQQLWM